MLMSWIGFLVAIVILLVGARRHLGFALIIAGTVLGLFTLTPEKTILQIYLTATDPSVVLLTISLSMIPIIGEILHKNGGLDDIVENLKIGKRAFLGISPALVGLLPLPGGALFSAPLVEKAGKGLEGHVKSGINVWFRHVLYFIYPLSPALIIPAKIAGISVYTVIKYQVPFFLISIIIGYIFLLRKVKGDIGTEDVFSFKRLLPPLIVILLAPFLDFSLQGLFEFGLSEISTFLAIFTSLSLAIMISDSKISIFQESFKEIKPWNFTILMLGIFIFINVFKASGMGALISSLSLSKLTLGIGMGFFLGVVTGRINLPVSILVPVFLTRFAYDSLPPLIFSLIYFAVFLGYVVTPVHPCVGITLEYFEADLGKFLKTIIIPVGVSLILLIFMFLFFV